MPFHVLAGACSMTVLRVRPSLTVELRSLQIIGEQIPDHVICEKLHPAVCMMDDEPFARSKQFVRDDERAYGIATGAPAGIPDDVSVTFRKAGIFRRI